MAGVFRSFGFFRRLRPGLDLEAVGVIGAGVKGRRMYSESTETVHI